MKKTLSAFLLSSFAFTWASAQQAPTTSPARMLTPAEQRQKEKVEKEVQRERQIRAEWAQKQREYAAKQAEKERQRLAKKAAKDAPPVEKNKPQETPASVDVAPPTNRPQPTEAAPKVAEPTRKAKKERQLKTKPQDVAPTETVPTAPVVAAPATPPAEKPQRVRRERKPATQPVDSVATTNASSVAEPTVVRARREFLPKGHLFDPILLDPLESQTYGSVFPAYWTEGQKYKGSIVPFAFGFAKPFYRHSKEPGHAEEWVLDLASFTQFEAYHDDVANVARRRIINTDYKISIIYNIRRGENNYRIRVYHLSSHLGDDYIFRNKITAPSPNAVNYEQLDFTYSRVVNNIRMYGGVGFVLRKTEERKLLSAQLGAFYKRPSTRAARLVGGVDVKFWQQTDFRPGIHGGVGIELGRTQNNLTFLLEGYSGFRPYSQYEDQQTSWIGVGLYLNPF